MDSFNIGAALLEQASRIPDKLAIALPDKSRKDQGGELPYQEITFKELAYETQCVSKGLLASGFQPGDKVVLMVPPNFDFFILSFSLIQSGIIPVLIDPGIGTKNLKVCIGEAEPNGFIGITKAHLARVILGWGKGTITKKVTLGPRLFWGGDLLKKIKQIDRSEAPAPFFEPKPDDLAAILFTSGSTGVPKGVMYTHGNFTTQYEMIRDAFQIQPGEVDLPTFPPFALFNPALGMSSVIPDMDPTKPAEVDPTKIIRAIHQYKINNMFGSPALINRVGTYGEANGVKLPTLNRVISAGAPVPTKALKRFSSMLNASTQIFTPYGATESMPIAVVGSHQLLEEAVKEKSATGGGICIGKPVPGMEMVVIRISDEPIAGWSEDLRVPVGVVGELVVKGANVTQAYYNREASTQLAKIKDGERFRHRMGDLGYQDENGDFWFCGRKAHRVQLADKELYSVQCESIFNVHPGVNRTALVGVQQGGKTLPVLCVEVPDPNAAGNEKLRTEFLERAQQFELTQDIKTLLFHPSFPVDIRHNSKIFREKLAVWAAEKLA